MYQNDCVTLYDDDNMVVLPMLDTAAAEVGITSPPYNLGGDFHSSNHATKSSKRRRNSYGGYAVDDDDNLPEDEYQETQIALLREMHRVIKPGGWLFYNHKNRIRSGRIISPLSWIEKSPWIVYQDIILDRMGSTNNDKRRFFPSHEIIFVLASSSGQQLFNANNLTSVWRVPRPHRNVVGHPASFPIEPPARCLSACPHEDITVIDPYMGIGTTGVAARRMGLRFIGIERNADYFAKAVKNITSTHPDIFVKNPRAAQAVF